MRVCEGRGGGEGGGCPCSQLTPSLHDCNESSGCVVCGVVWCVSLGTSLGGGDGRSWYVSLGTSLGGGDGRSWCVSLGTSLGGGGVCSVVCESGNKPGWRRWYVES